MGRAYLAVIILLLAVTPMVSAKDDAPWTEVQISRPFKAVWGAKLEDRDGSHDLRNGWVEREYQKKERAVAGVSREALGDEATEILRRKLVKSEFEKLLFAETEDHRLYALEMESGVIKWVSFFPRKIQYRPYFGDTSIFLTSDETLFATNREYGLLVWRHPLNFPISTSPVIGETGLMYMASWENRVFCYDTLSKGINWQFRVGGNVTATPLYEGGMIYVACEDGSLYCLKNTGELSFQYVTHGPLKTAPIISKGFVIVGSDDNSIYCLNRYNGEKIWECRIGRPLREKPEVLGKQVMVKPEGKGVTAISLETGKILWEMPFTDRIIGFGKDTLYLYTGGHRKSRLVVGVVRETGKILWVWDPRLDIREHFDEPLPNTKEINKVFFVRKSPGRIWMLGEKGLFEQISEDAEAATLVRDGVAKPAGDAAAPATEQPDDKKEDDPLDINLDDL
jgi:outer membrane protein assembly factor BamB